MSTTSAEVAEFSKLVENSFRDVNIAFANDFRESLSFSVMNQLIEQSQLNIFVHDPFMSSYRGTFSEQVHVIKTVQELVDKTDILLIKNNSLFDPSDFVLKCQQSKAVLESAIHQKMGVQTENI